MPIKDKSAYPPNWKQISARIRERAGHKCEECGVANGLFILRSTVDAERYMIWQSNGVMYADGTPCRMSEIPDECDHNRVVRVVLTVAHLNHDTTDNRDENLKCLCQLHHLRHDAKYHAKNAAVTRANKKHATLRANGQQTFLED